MATSVHLEVRPVGLKVGPKEHKMSEHEFDSTNEVLHETPTSHKVAFGLLTAGLVITLAGVGYLWSKSNALMNEINSTQSGTQAQISKLNDATTTLLQQEQARLEALTQEMQQKVKGANDSASIAIRRARTEAQKQGEELSQRLADQQQQVSGELDQLKSATTTASSKITEVSTDVDSVKQNVASTRSDLDKTGSDLKRVMGDMGVMSGLIATNSKDLDSLRALGERNYFEFDLTKAQGMKKIGDVMLTLKKSDPKRNRYTVDVLADDKRVEKKDKTMNEPVQLYLSGNMQPYEIVINQVKKDEVVGYLATPKVKVARR
jgi:F0F1-type ATP synthase membrane subunit b/b'